MWEGFLFELLIVVCAFFGRESQGEEMFKILKKMFVSKENEQEILEEESKPEPEIDKEPLAPPPEKIEIPWKISAAIYNYDVATKKIFADLKEFLFEAEVKKKNLWETAEKITNLKEETKDKIMTIYKERLNIPDDVIYDFEEPEATGRSAFLNKKKE
jgi:hypothetical protein